MFEVKLVNKTNTEDVLIDRTFESEKSAEKYYNRIKNSMIADPDRIIREYNEELEQDELTYRDVKLYLLGEEGQEISVFYVR